MSQTSEVQTDIFQKNILKIYLHSFFIMFIVTMPVVLPIFQQKVPNLTMQQFYELQAFFAFGVAILEIPTGYFSDLISRKSTLMIASFFYASSYSILDQTNSLFGLYLFEACIAIGVSFFSGTNISILYDSLNMIDRDRKKRTLAMGNIKFSMMFAEGSSAILCSIFLIFIGLLDLLKIQVILCWIPLICCFFIKEPPRGKMNSTSHYQNFKEIFKFLFFKDRLVTLIFINITIWSLATYFVVWVHQNYWMEQKLNYSQFGILWACYNLLVALISKFAHRFEEKLGPKVLVALIGISSIFGFLGMGIFGGMIGIMMGSLFQFSRGFNQVVLRDALNWRLPDEYRATANSIESMLFRLCFLFTGPLVGYSIDKFGNSLTLKILGCFFSILFVVFLIPLIKKIPKTIQS